MVITRTPTIVTSDHHHHDGGGGGDSEIYFRKGSRVKCGTTLLLVKGLTCTILGILFMIWTPFELIMDERLRMHKGLPPFDLWAKPPDQVAMSVYVFNFTNSEEFMRGETDILSVQEVGPIMYRELITHHNIRRNDNDTITYVAKHEAVYWDEANTIDLNDTIIVPNYAALSMATFLYKAPFFVKLGFNLLLRQLRTEMFKTMSIQSFLWNYTDPILTRAHELMPHLAPVTNIGMLERIYKDFEDEVTMFIGTKHGPEQFSLIEKFGGSDALPNYRNCDDRVTNASEGVTYGQFLTRKSVLKYWRKTVCKVVHLVYKEDAIYEGIATYKYVVPETSYDRIYPAHSDCYKGEPSLANGLTDVSNCMYNVPIVASFPHFLYANDSVSDLYDGLKPNNTEHNSYVYAEPITGVPLKSIARSQSNLLMRKLGGFSKEIHRFSDRVLPMFWLEYNQTSVPLEIYLLVYSAANLLRPGQVILILTLLIVGFLYTIRFGRTLTNSEDYQRLARRYKSQKYRSVSLVFASHNLKHNASLNHNNRGRSGSLHPVNEENRTSEETDKEDESFLNNRTINGFVNLNAITC